MSSIPSDLLCAILVRVPAEAVFNFRLVCKAWRRLIDDPCFRKAHTAQQRIIHNNNQEEDSHLFFVKKIFKSPMPIFLSLNSLFNYDDFNSTEFEFRTSIIPQDLYTDYSRFYVCNGLVLIQNNNHGSFDGWPSSWCIINPLTREIHKLPLHEDWVVAKTEKLEKSTTGFGYDSAADDYKIVYHTSSSCGKFESFIYRLKSNSWRKIKYDSRFFPLYGLGIFSYGALHWIGDTDKLVAFDLETEDMQFVSLGKHIMFCDFEDWELGSLGGSIAMIGTECYDLENSWKTKIYVMGNYGDESSWKTLYSSNNKLKGEATLISYSATKQILLLLFQREDEFLLVNLKTNTSQTREIFNTDSYIYFPQLFRPSLVRIIA